MTFPIRPVPPVGGVPLVRKEEDPERAAKAMANDPGKATSLLSGLLVHIDNVDRPQGMGAGNGSTLAAGEHIRRFVEGADPSRPPTQASFATVLLSVTLLEKDVRRKLGETVGQTGAPPAHCEAERERLQKALRTIVEVKRFHGPL